MLSIFEKLEYHFQVKARTWYLQVIQWVFLHVNTCSIEKADD